MIMCSLNELMFPQIIKREGSHIESEAEPSLQYCELSLRQFLTNLLWLNNIHIGVAIHIKLRSGTLCRSQQYSLFLKLESDISEAREQRKCNEPTSATSKCAKVTHVSFILENGVSFRATGPAVGGACW